jgi:hypothetical protein
MSDPLMSSIYWNAWQSLGLEVTNAADESSKGPASFMLLDPDGNPVLVDQHV